jgi:hypothetical protein
MPPSTTNSNWNWNPKMSIIMPLGLFARIKANKLGARQRFCLAATTRQAGLHAPVGPSQ